MPSYSRSLFLEKVCVDQYNDFKILTDKIVIFSHNKEDVVRKLHLDDLTVTIFCDSCRFNQPHSIADGPTDEMIYISAREGIHQVYKDGTITSLFLSSKESRFFSLTLLKGHLLGIMSNGGVSDINLLSDNPPPKPLSDVEVHSRSYQDELLASSPDGTTALLIGRNRTNPLRFICTDANSLYIVPDDDVSLGMYLLISNILSLATK